MKLNADFNARAVVHAAKQPWVSSPTPGVERRMLFRIGDEKARATSIAATPRAAISPPTAIPVARKSWCWMACSKTKAATIPPGPICAIRRDRATVPVPSGAA